MINQSQTYAMANITKAETLTLIVLVCVIFADAAKFQGSADGSIQCLFAYTPALRTAFHNIVKYVKESFRGQMST